MGFFHIVSPRKDSLSSPRCKSATRCTSFEASINNHWPGSGGEHNSRCKSDVDSQVVVVVAVFVFVCHSRCFMLRTESNPFSRLSLSLPHSTAATIVGLSPIDNHFVAFFFASAVLRYGLLTPMSLYGGGERNGLIRMVKKINKRLLSKATL